MKKTLLITTLIVLTLTFANAQSFNFANVHFGLKTGVNLSSFTDDVYNFDPNSPGYKNSNYSYFERYFRIVPLAGITADYYLNKSFALSAELIYNGRGAAYREPNGDVVTFNTQGQTQTAYNLYRFQLDYVELPLIAQFDVNSSEHGSSFILYGGIAPGVLVNKGVNYTYYVTDNNSPSANTASKQNDLLNVKGFELSPIAGLRLGGNHQLKNEFFADLRGEYTLLPVFNMDKENGYNLKTNMWTVGLAIGYRF
jgi:hypothetical protein